MTFRFLNFVMALSFFLPAMPCLAESAPIPESKKQSLMRVQESLATAEKKKTFSEIEMAEAERSLKQIREDGIKLAKGLRAIEQAQTETQQNVDALLAEQKTVKMRLEKDYGSIAETVLALERMRRLPPELLALRPGAPLEKAHAAMLLKGVLPPLTKRIESLAVDLERIKVIETTLAAEQKRLSDSADLLHKKDAELDKLLDKREKLHKTAARNYEEQTRVAAKLAQEARSMQELVDRLQHSPVIAEPPHRKTASRQTHAGLKGRILLPAGGAVVTAYGEEDNLGAQSEGIRIRAMPGSPAIAPLTGTVRFAGDFRNYGKIVIIEHKDGYHSLIGGLGKVRTATGQMVASGEPIGTMPSAGPSQAAAPELYYELRHKGQPVDPASLLADFKI